MRAVAVALVIGSAFAFAASGAAAEQASVDGRIVVRGSGGLGCLREPCWQPLASVPVTFLRDERVVAKVRSDRSGHFKTKLAPGSYVMQAPGLLVLSRDPSLPTGSQRIILRPGQTFRPTLVVRGRAGGKAFGRSLERPASG